MWFHKWLKTKHVTLMWITDCWYWASHPVLFIVVTVSEERVPPLELRNLIQVWLSLSLLYFIKILQLDKRCNNFTFSHLLYMWSLNVMITVKEYLTAQICQQITKQLLHARFYGVWQDIENMMFLSKPSAPPWMRMKVFIQMSEAVI